MLTFIKVCGVTRPGDARAAARLGADAVGMVFAPGSPRRVNMKQANAISCSLPPGTLRVGVFVNALLSEVTRCVSRCGLDLVQLHGQESSQYVQALTRTGLPVLKAFRIHTLSDVTLAKRSGARCVLLDVGPDAWNHPKISGALAKLARQIKVILAGGLTPSNIRRVVGLVRPFGVDVARGVERRPGVKDHVLMQAFMKAVRAA